MLILKNNLFTREVNNPRAADDCTEAVAPHAGTSKSKSVLFVNFPYVQTYRRSKLRFSSVQHKVNASLKVSHKQKGLHVYSFFFYNPHYVPVSC